MTVMCRMCRLSWFLDPGGWSKASAVGLYFIFPGICTLSHKRAGLEEKTTRPYKTRYNMT
ncbi:hypothetical protein STEG23_011266, partial [Scotinomys teguina]